METVGKKISRLRRQKGMSQEELADQVGVARQTVHKWEAGAVQPDFENTKSLCAVLDVPVDYFIENESFVQVAAENVTENGEKTAVVEPIFEKMDAEIKRKLWKSLVVAIVFTVLTFVPLFFSIITGMVVFSTNQGVEVVSYYNFDSGSFCVSLIFAILCFIGTIVGWIRYISMKKVKCKLFATKCKQNALDS